MLGYTILYQQIATLLTYYFQLRAGVWWLVVHGAFLLVRVVCLDDVSWQCRGRTQSQIAITCLRCGHWNVPVSSARRVAGR